MSSRHGGHVRRVVDTGQIHALKDVKIELPIWPRTFYCAGMNYVKHLTEAANARGRAAGCAGPARKSATRAQSALDRA